MTNWVKISLIGTKNSKSLPNGFWRFFQEALNILKTF